MSAARLPPVDGWGDVPARLRGLRWDHPAWLLVLAPLVWIALWRNLGDASLVTSDEAAHTDVARNILARGDWRNLWYFEDPYTGKPPLKIWATALTMSILGQEEWVVRLPDAALATVTTLLLWLLARRHLGGPATIAAPAIFVTAPYPLSVHGWREGVQDSALTTFLTLAAYGAVTWIERDRTGRSRGLWLMAGAVAGASMVKTVVALLIYPPVLGWLVLRHGIRSLWRTPVALAVVASGVPWALWYGSGWRGEVTWNLVKRVTGWPTEPHPPSVYWVWLSQGFRPWGLLIPIALLVAAVRGLKTRGFDLWIFAWAAGLLAPWTLAHVKHPWYIYPAYPAVALALARTILPPEAWAGGASRLVVAGRALGAGVALLGTLVAAKHAWWIGDSGERVVLDRAVTWMQTLPEAERSLAIRLDPRLVCPDERYYVDLAGGPKAYVPDVATLASMVIQEPRLFAMLPIDDLPELMRIVAPARPREQVQVAFFWPRCRRTRGHGRLPFRALVAFGHAGAPPPFEPMGKVRHWDGFGQLEENERGTFAWTTGPALLWFPSEGCGTLRMWVQSFHRENRLRFTAAGSASTAEVLPEGSEAAFDVDVPLGGSFGQVEVLDGCVRPSSVDAAIADDRCLGVSVGRLRVDPRPVAADP